MNESISVGIVGCGNLGEAIVAGLIAAGTPPASILASHPRAERCAALANAHKIGVTASNEEVVRAARVTLLAVKPQVLPQVMPKISADAAGRLLVSLAAGTTLATIAAALPGARLVRAMPNTPAAVRAGATGLYAGDDVGGEDRATVSKIFDAVGASFWVPREELFHALTGLSACGPAFMFAIAEALADGGVAAGLPRATASALAAHTVAGSGKMLLGGAHPGVLKDQVASPGGTTVHGLAALEAAGVRGGVMAAVIAAARRSREMASALPAPSPAAIAAGKKSASRPVKRKVRSK